MIRHLVRQVIKENHYQEFLAAARAWNEAAATVGLPRYRFYSSRWGTLNELFAEAEYEDSRDVEERFAKASAAGNLEFDGAFRKMSGLRVDGESHDYVLSELNLPSAD